MEEQKIYRIVYYSDSSLKDRCIAALDEKRAIQKFKQRIDQYAVIKEIKMIKE